VIISAPFFRVQMSSVSAPVLAVLTAALVASAAPVVEAQTRAAITRPDQAPVDDRRGRNQQAGPAQPQSDQDAPDGEVEPDVLPLIDPRAAPVTRPGASTATGLARRQGPAALAAGANGTATSDPGVDPDIDPDVGNGAQQLAGRQPADGDLGAAEAQAPRDGETAIDRPPVQADGDIALAEALTPDETEADETLREADRLGRPFAQRRFGPYQPVGIRVGSFILFPVLDAGVSSTDNVFRSATSRKSDMFSDATAGATLTSNWSRHALEFRVQGAGTFHNQFQTEDDRRLDALARGRIDISKRTNVVGDVSYSYGQEARGGVNTPTGAVGERPDVITRRASVEANHRVNRLSLQLRGAVTDNIFGTVSSADPVTGVSTTPTVNERNYVQRELGGRAGWQFSPNLTLYADTVLNSRRHEAAGVADGILRNSEGYRVQGGVAVIALGKLQGEASAGYASQTPDDGRLKTISGFIYNGRMSWQPTGLTEVIVDARSDIGDSTTAGSGGALTQQTGIELRHALRRHLIIVAGASYSVASFGGTSLKESSTVERLGLEYYLSREMALLAGYQHTAFESKGGTGAGSRYEDNTVRVGVRVRR
jgi:hypothetical protein